MFYRGWALLHISSAVGAFSTRNPRFLISILMGIVRVQIVCSEIFDDLGVTYSLSD